MMYIALPVLHDTGVLAVVRTSVSISSIDSEIKTIRNSILAALLVITFIAALTSLYVSRRISRLVEEMQKGAAEFAANVSHEQKTPLTTIKGFVETLQQRMAFNGIKESEAFFNTEQVDYS